MAVILFHSLNVLNVNPHIHLNNLLYSKTVKPVHHIYGHMDGKSLVTGTARYR